MNSYSGIVGLRQSNRFVEKPWEADCGSFQFVGFAHLRGTQILKPGHLRENEWRSEKSHCVDLSIHRFESGGGPPIGSDGTSLQWAPWFAFDSTQIGHRQTDANSLLPKQWQMPELGHSGRRDACICEPHGSSILENVHICFQQVGTGRGAAEARRAEEQQSSTWRWGTCESVQEKGV